MPPAKGKVIASKYTLQEVIGQGGAGVVWRAQHDALGSAVAIKLLATTASDEAVIRFHKEARATARLRSPNVVQVADCGVDERHMFIVMELLEGEDLRARLQRITRAEPPEIYRIVRQVTRALRKAHAAGIVHRDLKPGNLFLCKHDDIEIVKILDFGIAKSLFEQGITAPGTILGTPAYMSPEQALGSPDVDHRTDLWSLSVIVYRMLTGVLPFAGATGVETIQAVVRGQFSPPSRHVPALGAKVDAFFERAFSSVAANRFQDIDTLCAELELALDIEPGSSPSSPDWEVAGSSRRSPLPATGSSAEPAGSDRRVSSPTDAPSGAGLATRPSSAEPPRAKDLSEGGADGARRESPDGRAASRGTGRSEQPARTLLFFLFVFLLILSALLLVLARPHQRGAGALVNDVREGRHQAGGPR